MNTYPFYRKRVQPGMEQQYKFVSATCCFMAGWERQKLWHTTRFTIEAISVPEYICWLLAHPQLQASDRAGFCLMAELVYEQLDAMATRRE